MIAWLQRLFGRSAPAPTATQVRVTELEATCSTLQERLEWCDARLRERSELLYELQQHYSSEHFDLHESMRNLKIERLRNAGVFADRDVLIERSTALQERIRALKARLREHEAVEDYIFDDAPIVIQDAPPGQDVP